MGDIIKIFSDIGSVYEEDEKRIKNRAYEYDEIKCYLCDIDTKNITPSTNIPKDELIITRFGIGANSGNLFPNYQFISKDVSKDEAKFIKGVLKSVKNLMSYFADSDIENNEILKRLSELSEGFFDDIITNIKALDEHKVKDKKVATFFCLSYNEKPISSYFKEIFDKHIDKKEVSKIYGYDILTNEKGVGADANLAFCSVNELPENLKSVKSKLLPLNESSANRVKIGFLATDKELSHNFYGVKMAILPSVISQDKSIFKDILKTLKDSKKSDIEQVWQAEESINADIEYIAAQEKNLPVLNTILFYVTSNAAVNVLLQIDDVLPSYISKIAEAMAMRKVKAFKRKNVSGSEDIVYLQALFNSGIEVMKFLLSGNKFDTDTMVQKYCDIICKGSVNKAYQSNVKWSKFFNNAYTKRDMQSIKIYQDLFNEIGVLSKKIILQKEFILQDKNDKQDVINSLLENTEFIKGNDVLRSAYLLGMMCSGLISWQFAAYKGKSFEKWLNSNGVINQYKLVEIHKKCNETYNKIKDAAKNDNKNIRYIHGCLLERLSNAVLSNEIEKSSYVTLAFAMGGSDFDRFVKEKDEKKGE
ncbi:CRISPR-associated protein [Campylobacter sp. RM13119]|uniref:TM1802 family CRISPR-associated protein n=1 Tax=Campylobacter californiensis TaxID=1032243 RepID=UPI001473AC1C|nr:TM1802 family CRISPR-associated protein [Campylobacter sp. RM13119]MBE3606913.1 CRISPR-associated protein [Campylobacter sp. RM13119]